MKTIFIKNPYFMYVAVSLISLNRKTLTVADPGFPVGECGLPRRVRFENFVYQNERIGTLRGACAGHAPSRSANE